MRIKTLLLLSAAVLVAFTIVVGSVVSYATRQTDMIMAQGNRAESLMHEVFTLNLLSQEYVSHHEDRPKAQWYVQYDVLDRLLASEDLQHPPSSGYVNRLRLQLDDVRTSFDELVAKSAIANPVVQEQLAGDLLVKTQRLVTSVDEMAGATFSVRAATRERTDRTIFALLVIIAILAASIVFVIYRRTVSSLVRLQRGAEIIGKGDLDYKVGNDKRDEIGHLSRSFDAMTRQLKLSHETLEQRIKERTRELADLGEKSRVILQSIGDGVVAIDQQWNVILWNDAAARLTGWSDKEAVGRSVRSMLRFIREHDRSENVLFISDAMLSGKVRFMENHTLLIRKDGTEIPVADSAAPIIDSEGKISGAVIVFRDTTQERDAQLIKSSFAYASHQLRTPVTRALWALELVSEEAKEPEIKKRVAVTFEFLQSVHKLVDSLSEVSEIDQGIVTVKQESVLVRPLVAEVWTSCAKDAASRGISVRMTGEEGDITLRADPRLLSRALHEVFENAILYGLPKKEVVVDISRSSNDLVIEVRNEGMGIPAEQHGIVFTKFFRGLNVAPESIGAGLGLYISREYLRLLKGKVWFKSETDAPTSFFISLPHA